MQTIAAISWWDIILGTVGFVLPGLWLIHRWDRKRKKEMEEEMKWKNDLHNKPRQKRHSLTKDGTNHN